MADEFEPLEEEAPKRKRRKKPEPKTAMIQRILEDPATLIGTLVARTESIMSPRAQAWRRYRAKYRLGLQYMSGDSGRVPDIFTVNYLFSNVEAVKANVGKSMPKITVKAFEVSDQLTADLVSKMLESSLLRGGLPRAQRKVVHHGALTGVAWFKHWFNPDQNDGEGGNVVDCVPPEDVLVDPLAVPFLTQDGRTTARYLIHRRRDVSWDEIEATYDVNTERLFGDDADTIDPSVELGFSNDFVNDVRQKPFGNLNQNPYGKVLDVYECWLQTFEPFEMDEEGNVISSPWYIITVAGDKVLKKEYSPYQHGKLPFVPWFDGEDDGAADFYHIGIGEVEEIEMLQDKAALLDLQIYRNIKMTVNRQRIVNRLMGVTKDTVDNREGRVYEVAGDPRLAMVWDTPPQLGNDVYTYRVGAEKAIQDVSGVTDVMSGRKPTGIAAAKAIGALQNASQARINDKQTTLIQALRHVAEMDLANMFQFYTTERVIRLLDGDTVRVIGEYPPELQPGYQPPMQEAGVDPMSGAPVPAMELPPLGEGPELDAIRDQWKAMNGIDLVLSDVDRRYDLEIGEGSPLPDNKGELGQLALDMFRIGLIDRAAALNVLEWPDRAEIIERMGATQTGPGAAAQPDAMMQMLQQMMGGGGGMPGGGMPIG